MTYSTFPFFHQRFLDSEGNPLAGGSLTFYAAGSTALKDIYLDQSGTPAQNPMPLDSTGLPVKQYFGGSGEYDIIVKNSVGAIISKSLRINASGGGGGAIDSPSRGYFYYNGSSFEWRELSNVIVTWAIIDNVNPDILQSLLDGWDTVTKEKIYNAHWGIASNENDDLSENTSNSKVIYFLEKDGNDEWVWIKTDLDIEYPILNFAEATLDYLHAHYDVNENEPSNYPSGIWTSRLFGDSYEWVPMNVREFPEPVFSIDGQLLRYRHSGSAGFYEWVSEDLVNTGKVKVDSEDPTSGYLENKVVSGDNLIDIVKGTGAVGKKLSISLDVNALVTILNERTDLKATPKGPAGGDLWGTYPDPIVRQLTGVGANLTAANDDAFAYDPTTAYGAGRCIASGKAYYGSEKVERKCWTMLSKNANVYRTFNYWKDYKIENTVLKSKPNVTANEGSQLLGFVYGIVPGTSRWAWMWIAGDCNYHWYFSEHIPENYDNDGNTVVWSDAQTFGSVSNYRTPCHVSHYQGVYFLNDAFDHKNQLLCTKDWQTFELVTISSDEEITVPGNDGYGNLKLIERDTGIVHKCTYDANNPNWYKTWEVEDTIYLNKATTPVGNFPEPTNASIWYSSIQSMYGTWVISVAKDDSTNTEKPSFWYSEDGVRWNSVIDSSFPHFWEANTDGVRWFASNFEQSGSPIVYQLLLNQIPAHRQLVAEKGIIVDGDAFLTEMTNAPSLGTDENGKIVAGQGAVAQIGDAPKVDYAFSPYNGGTRKWIPNDKASGPVEALMGSLVRDEVNHTITVPAYTVQLFDNNDFLGQPLRYNVAQTTFTLSTPNVVQYVYARYISPGVAQTIITPFVEEINFSSSFPLFIVERLNYTDGSSRIHHIGFDTLGEGLAQKTNKMIIDTVPYRRTTAGGLMIGSSALQVTLTGAVVYAGVVPHTIAAFNSSTDKLFHAYKVSGAWTYAVESAGTVNNSQYQNGNNLASLGTNKYKNVWIYRSIGDDKECFYVDSTAQYNTLSDALADTVPSDLPAIITWHCMLVGRIAMQNGQTSGYTTQSAFINAFNVVTGSSGNFIRNQDSNGTNDAPGNIFLDPAATINIRYEDTGTPANNVNWFSVSKDMLKLQGLDVNNPALIGYQAELTPSVLVMRGRPGTSYGIYNAAAFYGREGVNWVPNVNGAWFSFTHQDLGGGTAEAQGGYRFPRLKFRISDTDTVSAEMVHKIVDANGNELPLVDNGIYGKALKLPAGGGGGETTLLSVETMPQASAMDLVYIAAGNGPTAWTACATIFTPRLRMNLVGGVSTLTVYMPQRLNNYIEHVKLAIYKYNVGGGPNTLVAITNTIDVPAAASNQQLYITATINSNATLIAGDAYFGVFWHDGNGSLLAGRQGNTAFNVSPLFAFYRTNVNLQDNPSLVSTLTPENATNAAFFFGVKA